jgi:hypothetical protein
MKGASSAPSALAGPARARAVPASKKRSNTGDRPQGILTIRMAFTLVSQRMGRVAPRSPNSVGVEGSARIGIPINQLLPPCRVDDVMRVVK